MKIDRLVESRDKFFCGLLGYIRVKGYLLNVCLLLRVVNKKRQDLIKKMY